MKKKTKDLENLSINKKDILNLISENIQDLLLISDSDGYILYISSSAKQISGYEASDIIGHNMREFICESDFAKYDETIAQIKKGVKRTFKTTYKIRKADGSTTYLENVAKPFHDDQGNIRIISNSRDLTEVYEIRKKLKKREIQLSIAAQELQHFIYHANAPIFGIDWSGKINEWNSKAERITGFKRDEVLGQKFTDEIVPKSHQVLLLKIFKDALVNKKATNLEIPLSTKKNQKRNILFSCTPRRDSSGEIIGVLCYGQDITEQIEYQEKLERRVQERTKQLKESLEKEKEGAVLKNRFISMASHEFKTPLSTISFAAEFIERYLDKAPRERIQERLKKIKEQVYKMVYLLNDVLAFGKTEEGRIKPNYVVIDLKSYVKDLLEDINTRKGDSIKVLVKYNIPKDFTILTDPVLLNNVCSNFLLNSIKYSPGKEKAILEISVKEQHLIFNFIDFGIGIPKEDQEKIFDPFYRSINTSGIEGTGLGLSIAKRAADSLGGDVRLVKSSTEGTTFQFTLPINTTN